MDNIRRIATLKNQKHSYQDLKEIFNSSTQEERATIIEVLGLNKIIDNNGEIVPVFSLDIKSDKPTYITKEYNITLTGSAYNFFANVDDDVSFWRWTRDSGDIEADEAWKEGKNSKTLVLSREDFTEEIATRDIKFILTVSVGGKIIIDSITFSSFQILSTIQIKASANVFVSTYPDTVILSALSDSDISSYRWYFDDVFKSASETVALTAEEVQIGKAVVIKLEAVTTSGITLTDSISIPRIKNGTDGVGVEGPPGADGSANYTWIKYATNQDGADMSDYPIDTNGVSREYIGMAPNKKSPIESSDPTQYTWSKYIGSDGVKGDNGYMWIKYSEYYNGRNTIGEVDMHDTPYLVEPDLTRENLTYMGIAYNKEELEEGNVPEDYLWAKILGEDGHTNYLLDLSNDNVSIPVGADGTASNPTAAYSTAKTELTLYYGNEVANRADYVLSYTNSDGISLQATDFNHKIKIVSMAPDVGEVLIKAHPRNDLTKVLSSGTFNITKIKGSAAYEITVSSNAIKVNTNAVGPQTVLPQKIDVKVQINTGQEVLPFNGGALTYRYIFANTDESFDPDGSPMDRSIPFTINNLGDPLFVEFKFFHPVTNVMVDRERIPFIRDGVNGTSSFTWIKYADTGTGINMSDYPLDALGKSKMYIGIATNKSTPVESNLATDYIWSKYIGTDGIDGVDGTSTFTWIKYSEYYNGRTPGGSVSMQDEPYSLEADSSIEPMTYIGIGVNKTVRSEIGSTPEDYVWSKILGDNGVNGADGANGVDGHTSYIIDLSNDNVSIPALGDGSIPNPAVAFSLAKTKVKLYYGNEPVGAGEYNLTFTPSSGLTVNIDSLTNEIKVTGMTVDVAEVVVRAYGGAGTSNFLTSNTFSVTKVRSVSSYEILASASVIKISTNLSSAQTITPAAIDAIVQINTGQTVTEATTGRMTYRYVYPSTAGTEEAGTEYIKGSILDVSNEGDPLYLEFKYFHPVTDTLVDSERIPFVRDGINGLTTEFRYKKNTSSLVPPALDRNSTEPDGWTIQFPTLDLTEILWMTKANKRQQGGAMVGQWEIPTRVTGAPGSNGINGTQGPPGITGTSGPIPRTFEWVAGEEYQNGGAYIDYIYYRSQDANVGWYTVKVVNNALTKKIANIGSPNAALFNKEPFSAQSTFGTVIAEQANLAGFLFRNQVLQSQLSTRVFNPCTQVTNDIPNLTIDGIVGSLNLLNRLIINSEGILLKDDCGQDRIKIGWEPGTSNPSIQYLGENGEVTWSPATTEVSAYHAKYAILLTAIPTISLLPTTTQPYICKVGTLIKSKPVTNVIGYTFGKGRNTGAGSLYTTQNSSGPVAPDGIYFTGFSVVEATTQVGGQGGGPGFTGTPAHIKPNFFKVTAGVIGPYITNGFGSNPSSVHSYPYDTNLVNNNC